MNLEKRRLMIALMFILLIAIILFFSFWDLTPAPFPSHDQLLNKMNQQVQEVNAEVIQDSIHLDEKNVFVPFITKNKEYGTSFWVWKNRNWNLAEVSVNDTLKLWKSDNDDPSSYRFVWNLPPDEKMSYIKVYFMKDRMHTWSDDKHYYEPRIQMEERISNEGKTYGVLPVSNDWATVMNELRKRKSIQQQHIFYHLFNTHNEYYFSWNSYDVNRQEYPLKSLNDSFSWHGDTDVEVEHVFFVNEGDLEYPEELGN